MRSIESRSRAYNRMPTGITDGPGLSSDGMPRGGWYRAPGNAAAGSRAFALFAVFGRLSDGLAVLVAGALSYRAAALGPFLPPDHALLAAFTSLLTVNLLHLANLYESETFIGDRRAMTMAPLLLCSAIFAPAELWRMAGGPPPDWQWLLDWSGADVAWLLASRLCWLAATPRLVGVAALHRHILVVGSEDRSRAVLDMLAGQGLPPGLSVSTGPIHLLRDLLRQRHVDDVIVALPWADEAGVSAALAVLREYAVDVHLFPDDPRALQGGRRVSLFCGVPMLTLSSRPMDDWGRLIKALEDRVLGGLLLLLTAPLLVLIGIAIRLETPGPVLFRQTRYGFNNEVFVVFKFRSMFAHPPGDDLEQAKRNDPRVTRVGSILRRTSLDELPQLLNVLNGSMSLVGPRPHAVEHQNYYQHLVDEYRCRHRMKPGMTGWAQVNGYRGETSTVELMRKRVEYDLYYIENWSLFFDIWILFLTPFACLWGKNAY